MTSWLPALVAALVAWECPKPGLKNSNDGGRAAGPLQIHKIVVDDVNRVYNTSFQWPDDAHDIATAKRICTLYLDYWLQNVPNPTPQAAARIWNGGPNGWRKRATQKYWKSVRPIYQQMSGRTD